MTDKQARAEVAQIRQTTQFTCCAASIASALHALGKKVTEDDVNMVLGAAPMAGATWEAMLATVQYFGCRGTLVVPATPRMLKDWTDKGIPVVIAWNPEGRPWSHASTVFDVKEDEDGKLTIYVMDSNIPNPSETTRVMDEDTFCQKWGEKVSDSLIVRRPAMAVTLEVSPQGRQVLASTKAAKRENNYYFTVLGEGKKTYREVERDLPALLKREGWTRVEVHDEMRDEHEEPDPAKHRWAAAHDLRLWELHEGDKVRGTGNLSANVAGPWGHLDKNDHYVSEKVTGRSTGVVVDVRRDGAFKGFPLVRWDDSDDSEPKLVHPANLIVTTPGRMVEIMKARTSASKVADAYLRAKEVVIQDKNPKDYGRTEYGPEFVTQIMRHPGYGRHQNREQDVAKGRGKPKHKKPWGED